MRLYPLIILATALDRCWVEASSSPGPTASPAAASSSVARSDADRGLPAPDTVNLESTPSTDSSLLRSELGPSEDAPASATSSSAAAGDASVAPSLVASLESPSPPLARQGRRALSLRLPAPMLRQFQSLRERGVDPRLANLADRTLPAVALLSVLFGAVRFGGERGLRYLLLALSPGLYHEASSVASSSPPAGCSNRWVWFVAYSLMLTLPNALSPSPTQRALVSPERLQWIGYSSSLLGWMSWVIRLNGGGAGRDGNGEEAAAAQRIRFSAAWGEVAAQHMAALVTLVPLSAWMKLLSSGRMDWALYAALLVICNDTFAYLVGRFAGRRPLLPTISPNKTVEGWAGAFLLTTLASPLIWARLFQGMPYSLHSLHIALFASVVAPFGGFLASAVKRASAKKDFGSLLGSHGGLMDRLDCQLITAPYLYLLLAAVAEL